jgi:hypothetical protein
MLLVAPWVLLGVWVVYEISYVSFVRVDAQGVVVQNMLRRTSFGWGRVVDVDLKWQLQFSLDDGSELVCWGGPARARPPRPGRGEDAEAKAPAGLQALTQIRDRWDHAVAANAPLVRTWDRPAILALAVIVVWAVLAVLIANAG